MTQGSAESLDRGTPPPRAVGAVCLTIAKDIKLSHSVFAMPFAVLAMLLAAAWAGRLPHAGEVGLIVMCMFFARTAAMTANRYFDARLDADNPRTAGRAVPSGRVSRRGMGLAVVLSSLLFLGGAAGFWFAFANPWPIILSLPVLAVLLGYSLMKRISWLCHLVLGLALGISPLAAAIAIEPGYLAGPVPYLLAGMVLCWVAGFDVIYALQDVAADREQGLHSMPSRLGVEPALWISRALHVVSAVSLAAMWWLSPLLGPAFLAAACVTWALLILEQTLVWRSKTHHIHMAFFTLNGVIALLLGLGGGLDAVLKIFAEAV